MSINKSLKKIKIKEKEINKVLNLLDPALKRIEQGRQRMEAVWEGEEPDYIPILLPGAEVPEKEEFISYNLKEQFYDPGKMLIGHLWGMISANRTNDDSQLAIRANLGTGFIPTVFGVEQKVFADKMPWVTTSISKNEIKNLSKKDLENNLEKKGLVPRALEYYEFYKSHLPEGVNTYVNDTQGPFDIAHLIYGDKMFTDLYDDPDFVHHLLELSTEAYIKVTKLIKEKTGEDLDSGYHGKIYMSSCGVRCCEDTTTLISSEQFEEFAYPYIRKALKPFGGGWVHWCGSGHQFLDKLIQDPLVKGINFGNPERYDWEKLAPKLIRTNTVYNGNIIAQKENESITEYFQRALSPLTRKSNLIFHAQPHENCDWSDSDKIYEIWKDAHKYIGSQV